MRPGADPILKPVFAGIGVPDKMPFRPDPFQIKAVSAIGESDCLVTAPTGSGKTWIAVQAIKKVLGDGGKSWYASPLKALTNAKLTEFSALFGKSNVGILTGDRKENPGAPIIVGTTEILRNQLYDAMHQGISIDTDFVVVDEAHYLGDEDRGVVWEETFIYLPSRIPLLMLSATIGNADQIAGWLETIRKNKCRVIMETKRPVPLYPLVLHPRGTILPMLESPEHPKKKKLYKKVAALAGSRKKTRFAGRGKLPPFGEILKILGKYNLLPAIFFLKSRADCDAAVSMCHSKGPVDLHRQDLITDTVDALIKNAPHLERHRQRRTLSTLAVGSHHSGQLPGWKLVLETLMSKGMLDAIFATSTVAAGVNFPARTVLFLNSDRFNGSDFVSLDTTQLLQMTGRAGRRGMDRIGFAMAIPGRFMDIPMVARLMKSPSDDVLSRIRINFSMTLNLLLSHTPDQVQDLLKRCFATFLLMKKNDRTKARRRMEDIHEFLWEDFKRHLFFLQDEGFVDDDFHLTEDGISASQLRIDQPLIVAESLRKGLLSEFDPAMMAAVFGAFVNEKETDERKEGRLLPNPLKKKIIRIQKGLKGFSRHMAAKGFDVRPVYMRPAAILFAWAGGIMPWEKLTREFGMAEGDLAMLIVRTADNLRHVAGLSHAFPKEAKTARSAIELIMRAPVVPDEETT